jgi:hypothetical protein
MYTLFKKLRRKFISENDSTGYYKYALGELFLVTVGILLALQVDNWNEERKDANPFSRQNHSGPY